MTTEKDHPAMHCYTCRDYLDHRQDTLPAQIAAAAKRQNRPGREVFEEFMQAAHQRHLDGEPLRPGGPTRITDPYLGRLAAFMALGAGIGNPPGPRHNTTRESR